MIRWMLIFAVAHVAAVAIVYGDEDQPKAPAGEFAPSDDASLIYEEAQRLRIYHGLGRQPHDQGLASIAQRVANYQASRGGMCHTNLGDNVVAYGETPRGTVKMWLDSPPHRSHVLGGAKLCGYGFARAASGRTFAAGIFRDAPAALQDAEDMAGISGASNDGPRLFGRLFGRRR